MKKLKHVRGVALSLACMMTAGSMAFVQPARAAEIVPEVVEVVPETFPEVVQEIIAVQETAVPEAEEVAAEEVIESMESADAAGDSFDTAVSLNAGTNTTVNFTTTYSARFYRFTTPSDGYVKLTLSHPLLNTTDNCWCFDIFDASKERVTLNHHGDALNSALRFKGNVSPSTGPNIGLAKGTYCLRVFSVGRGAEVPLTLRYDFVAQANREKEPNDQYSGLNLFNTVSLNTAYIGSLHGRDVDDYEFTLPQKGYVTLEFRCETVVADRWWDVCLLQMDREVVSWLLPKNNNNNFASAPIGLNAGTYRLRIDGEGSYTPEGDYTFKINFTPDTNGSWEVEPNNSYDNANRIATDKLINGSINFESDYYWFELPQTTTVSITFNHIARATNEETGVYLYDKDRKRKLEVNVPAGKASYTTEPVTLEKGLNYLCINNWNGSYSNKAYTLKVNTGAAALTTSSSTETKGTWKKAKNGKWWYDQGKGKYPKSKWLQIDGKYYYFDKNGYMVTGWKRVGKKWYYMNGKGIMQTGWVKSSGKWYYMDKKSGAMKTGWVQDGGKWYYLNKQGVMKTGWVKSGGKWYYMDGKGRMLSNTSRKIGKKTYRFDSKGRCTNP